MNLLTQLAVEAAKGNKDALNDLINDPDFRRRLRVISRATFRAIPIREPFRDADDLEQDIYERLLRKIDTFEGKCEIQTWVSKLARNIQFDRLERLALENDWLSQADVKSVLSDPLQSASLRNAIQQLDPKQRHALALKVAGANLAQIGRQLGLAKSQAHRIIVGVEKLLLESI